MIASAYNRVFFLFFGILRSAYNYFFKYWIKTPKFFFRLSNFLEGFFLVSSVLFFIFLFSFKNNTNGVNFCKCWPTRRGMFCVVVICWLDYTQWNDYVPILLAWIQGSMKCTKIEQFTVIKYKTDKNKTGALASSFTIEICNKSCKNLQCFFILNWMFCLVTFSV